MAGRRCCLVGVSVLAISCGASAAPGIGASPLPRFTAPVEVRVGHEPIRIVAADFNGDGRPDLATAESRSHTVSVALGRGDGSFRKHIRFLHTPAANGDVAAGDVNGDGRIDLVATSYDRRGSVVVFANRGDGAFRPPVTYHSGAGASVALADINNDGAVDIVTDALRRGSLAVLLNRGNGSFGPAHRIAGRHAALDLTIGDLNEDGNPDAVLATGGDGNMVVVRLGRGDGSFGPEQTYKSGRDPGDVTLVDLNGDGHIDVAVANAAGNTVSVWLGRGDGTLVPSTTYAVYGTPESVVAGDFNLDGLPDIATSTTAWVPTIANGRGDGRFDPVSEIPWLYHQGAATADFNLDGRPDLAFAGTGYRHSHEADVYLNWTGLSVAPCVVLNLEHDPLRLAKYFIATGACRSGHVDREYSSVVRRGDVIAQRPRTGTVSRHGSRVDVIVSRGPRPSRSRNR